MTSENFIEINSAVLAEKYFIFENDDSNFEFDVFKSKI